MVFTVDLMEDFRLVLKAAGTTSTQTSMANMLRGTSLNQNRSGKAMASESCKFMRASESGQRFIMYAKGTVLMSPNCLSLLLLASKVSTAAVQSTTCESENWQIEVDD